MRNCDQTHPTLNHFPSPTQKPCNQTPTNLGRWGFPCCETRKDGNCFSRMRSSCFSNSWEKLIFHGCSCLCIDIVHVDDVLVWKVLVLLLIGCALCSTLKKFRHRFNLGIYISPGSLSMEIKRYSTEVFILFLLVHVRWKFNHLPFKFLHYWCIIVCPNYGCLIPVQENTSRNPIFCLTCQV